jgi:hypothetical protein
MGRLVNEGTTTDSAGVCVQETVARGRELGVRGLTQTRFRKGRVEHILLRTSSFDLSQIHRILLSLGRVIMRSIGKDSLIRGS